MAASGAGVQPPAAPTRLPQQTRQNHRHNHHHRQALALVVGALLLAGLGTLPEVWSRWLAPPWGEVIGQAEPGCDVLQRACRVDFADGSRAIVTLQSDPLKDSAALALTVQMDGRAPRSIGVDLDVESMNMGPNHTELSAGPQGRWTGHSTLSVCITGRMAWILTLRAPLGGGERVARLRFETGEP